MQIRLAVLDSKMQLSIHMKKLVWTVVTMAAALGCTALAETQTNDAAAAGTALAVFERVERRFSTIGSIEYTASRTISMGQQKMKDKWTFIFKAPSSFRLHYMEPQERIIVANEEVLWEYIPEAKKAVRTDLLKLSDEARSKLVVGIIGRVSLDGIRVGQYQDLVKRTTGVSVSTNNPAVLTIVGEGPRFSISVDTNRQIMLQSEIYDASGEMRLRTKGGDFRQASGMFWYPYALELVHGTPEGYALGNVTLKDVKINEPVSDDTFKFVVPKRVKVVDSAGS